MLACTLRVSTGRTWLVVAFNDGRHHQRRGLTAHGYMDCHLAAERRPRRYCFDELDTGQQSNPERARKRVSTATGLPKGFAMRRMITTPIFVMRCEGSLAEMM